MKKDHYKKILEIIKDRSLIRYTSLEKESLGEESLFTNPFSGRVLEEELCASVQVCMFGAGHVGKALYKALDFLGLDVIVVDSREELLDKEEFKNAKLIQVDYEKIDALTLDLFNPYYCIFTHGHRYDKDVLRYCLSRSNRYIGMIGSKGKVAATLNELENEGFSREVLDKVHAPIGLPIGGSRPCEIAISIAAEIINTYSKNKNSSKVDIDLFNAILKEESGVLCRIISKKGSAPREVGTSMFVTDDHVYGTIGGGELERRIIAESRALKTSAMIKEYKLSSKGDINMICGGDQEILFQKID